MNRNKSKTRILAARLAMLLLCCLSSPGVHAQQVISLEGAWDFAMGDSAKYDDYVMLPGSMLTNGKGLPVTVSTPWTGSLYDSSYYFNPYMEKYRQEGRMKFPFFLTPDRHYVGKAWYRRTVYVPEEWAGLRVTLFLERPHIETTVYVNGHPAGHQMSLSTPHRYDIGKFVKAGARNDIEICVYNGIENVGVGQDSHSVTDQTQGNWNGIAGRLELQAQWDKVNIRHVSVYPDAKKRQARIVVELGDYMPYFRVMPLYEYYVNVHIEHRRPDGRVDYSYSTRKDAYRKRREFVIDLGPKARLWDEFSPELYHLTVEAGDDCYQTTFGLRDIAIKGRQFYINGRPLFLRGTVENCCFPETGYPPTDEESWLKIFAKCQEYGLNHVRFHSYCPPEAAFAAADRMGIYLQPEGPSWPNHGVKLNRGMPIDQYLMDESKRIIDEYGHHPSFVMMAAGNEPAGDWVTYCNKWVETMHDYDSTRVYCGASVGGGWAWDSGSEYHVKGGARGLDEWNRAMPSSDNDYYDGIEFPRNYKDSIANQTPIVTHEKGQWCAFPDLGETSQYTGAYKARNFEIFSDLLRDNGMASQAGKFLHASGMLQTLCYKHEIERNLRTPDYAGFQLLGLNDYSGQGTALTGVLNVHWREKGYCTASQWREFCSPVVLLARFPRFVFTSSDTLRVPLEAYNAFRSAISDVQTTFYITNEQDEVVCGGILSKGLLPIGKNIGLGTVVVPLDSMKAPSKYTLVAQFSKDIRNHWDFWVYPDEVSTSETGSSELVVSDSLDERAIKALRQGGSVLLTAAGRVTLGSDVKQTYLPVFWNTSWFKMRPPHTTGAYIDKSHPLFSHGFPTDDWSNLNWWELLNKAQVMNLRELPPDYQPPIQPIDTWHVSRKLGMLIEARVLGGRLLMTTMDIASDLAHRPVARQMRHAIESYMLSSDFNPTLQLSAETIRHFYTEQAPAVSMFTNDSPDELKPKIK